jgi:hypothetical protein
VAARQGSGALLNTAAYGFRIAGAPEEKWLSVSGGEHWPTLTLRPDPEVSLHDQARVDWGGLHAGYCPDLPLDELVHPLLGRMLMLLVEARGIDAMHGGVLLTDAGAWAVIGPREAGKSSLLAQCHTAGVHVASDDIIVFEGTRCLAGPRCIDLRDEPAQRLGPGVPVRSGTKQRITLPPVPAEAELVGVVYLAWGASLELVPLRPSERLRRLAERRAEEMWPRSRSLVFDLAALPAFELRRPHGLDSLPTSAELLIERLRAVAPASAAARER